MTDETPRRDYTDIFPQEPSRTRVARYRFRQRAISRDPRLQDVYQGRPHVDDALDDEIDAAVQERRPVDMSTIDRIDEDVREQNGGHTPSEILGMSSDDETDDPEVPDAPGQRLAAVNKSAKEYKREYEYRLLYRMLMRNLPLDMIARSMNCSVKTVIRRRKELYKLLAEQAAEIPMELHAGQTLSFYNEVRGMCMRMATDSSAKTAEKLGALEIALKAEQGKHTFLEKAGFYDVGKLPPKRNTDDPHHEGASVLSKLARDLLEGGDDILGETFDSASDDDDDDKPRML